MSDIEELDEELTLLEDLVLYLVEPLVSLPDEVIVTETPGSDGDPSIVRVEVAAKDVGRVIGRQGRVIQSLRTLLSLSSETLGQAVEIDLVD